MTAVIRYISIKRKTAERFLPGPSGILTKVRLHQRNVQTDIQNGITVRKIHGLILLSHGIGLWNLLVNVTVNTLII